MPDPDLSARDDEDRDVDDRWLELAARLRDEGGLLGRTVRPFGRRSPVHADVAVALVQEGHDCHYAGTGAVLAPPDLDLALLAGDALYAMGLEELAERGDLLAIGLLADVISRCAQAHAEDRSDAAEALWEEAARQLQPTGRSSVRWSPFS